MVRLRLLSTSSVVEAAKLVVATTFRSAVNVKAEPESRATNKESLEANSGALQAAS
jgi:hypothetical protein